jgi:hypothetical protein
MPLACGRNLFLRPFAWLLLVAGLATACAAPHAATRETLRPLPRAHAHNDYEHPRPLLDALDQGFCSVEADVYLVNGELLVAHDRPDLRPDRTLQALYLEPLRERIAVNGGWVHRGAEESLTLLIDIKADAELAYARLRELLAGYRDMLTAFGPGRTRAGAVTVILSGDRPWNTLEKETERLAALDGRLADLDRDWQPDLVPLISDRWGAHFTWNGSGPFPEAERIQLREIVERAHRQGRRVRFWGAADQPAIWRAQLEAGVDLINTDRLAELAGFLRNEPR